MTDSNATRTPSTRGELIGCVKWFNNKEGYGFVTIVSDGGRTGEDIFTHQSNIYPTTCGYRTLRAGEYISLNLSDEDRPQAIDVTGVLGGALMCDTELRLRNETSGHRSGSGQGSGQGSRNNNRNRTRVPEESHTEEDGWKDV